MFTKIALALAVVVGTASFSAYAQSPRTTKSHAAYGMQADWNPNAVYFDGKKVGQDPDPNVRRELLQNAHSGAY